MNAGTAAIDADGIDALLPQTQCTRCGFAGCRPYADAIHLGAADINQCPPGGQATIDRLAALLGRPSKPLNPDNGSESAPMVAWIDAQRCIGCAKCLPPCPVDAIVGASKFLHAVIVEHCTGCELCVAPCPVDCIVMRPAPAGSPPIEAAANRRRYQRHQHRLEHRQSTRARELEAVKSALNATTPRPAFRTPENGA